METTSNKQNGKGWSVTSGANRNSRGMDSLPIPPVAPIIALAVDQSGYSPELKNGIQAYISKNRIYEEMIDNYLSNKKGNPQELWNTYNETMELYVAYYVLAKKEGNFVQPIPAYKNR